MKLAIYNNGIPFDGDSPFRQPLGGSESGIVYMAAALAQCGHTVTVYSNCPNAGNYRGVEYVHYQRFFTDYRGKPGGPWDTVIAFRSFDPMLLGRIAPRIIYWTGDASDQPCLEHFEHPALQDNVDLVFCVSNWHRDTFIRRFGLPAAKVVATRNGFSPALIDRNQQEATRSAYTSTPFRGLSILLHLFPELRRRIPSATLDVFSSMKVYGWSDDDDRKAYGPIYDSANQEGVTWRGSVSQPVLLRALTQTGLLLYPNTFDETSCIAAIEAQAAGCVVITSAKAGLNETVANGETGICIAGDPSSTEYQRSFVEAACGVMANPELFARLSAGARERAFRMYSWNVIASEWTHILENLAPKPVSGRFSGPLSLLELTSEYLRVGNHDAARRVLSNVDRTPFFKRQREGLRAAVLAPSPDDRGA